MEAGSDAHVQKKKSKKRRRNEVDCGNMTSDSATHLTTPNKNEKLMPLQNSFQLIEKLKTTLDPATAKKKYDKGLAEVNWEEVVVGEYTVKECQDCVKRILRKLRKYRTLEEILEDAFQQLKNNKSRLNLIATPEAERRYRAEYGNKPPKGTTASRLYVDKMVAKAVKKNPSSDKLHLKKKFLSKWHNKLADKKKIKYIKKALEAKRKHEEALKLYLEVYPDYKHNTPSFLSKSDQKLLDQSQGVPEPPPKSGYLYFFHCMSQQMDKDEAHAKLSLTERAKQIGKDWKELSQEKRTEYSKTVEQKTEEYKVKMEEFLSKLTPEERTRFESDHLKPAKKSSKTAADAPTSNYVTAVELYQVMKRSKFESKYPDKSTEEIMSLMQESYESLPDKKKAKYEEQEKKLRDIASTKAASPLKKPSETNHVAKNNKKPVPTRESEKKGIQKVGKTGHKPEVMDEESSSSSQSEQGSKKVQDGSSDSESDSEENTKDVSSKSNKTEQNGGTFTAIKTKVKKKTKQSSSSGSASSTDSSSDSSSEEAHSVSKGKITSQVTEKKQNDNITASFSSSSESSASSDSSSEETPTKKRKVEPSLKKATKESESSTSNSSSSSSGSSSEDEAPVKKRKAAIQDKKKTRDSSCDTTSSSSSSEEEAKSPKKKSKPDDSKMKLKLEENPGIKRLVSPSKTPIGKGKKHLGTLQKEKVFLSPAETPSVKVIKSSSIKTPSKKKTNIFSESDSVKTPSNVSSPKVQSLKNKGFTDSPVKKTPSVKVKPDVEHVKSPVVKKGTPKRKPMSDDSSSDSDSD